MQIKKIPFNKRLRNTFNFKGITKNKYASLKLITDEYEDVRSYYYEGYVILNIQLNIVANLAEIF